jgi:UDP-N-acetylmuramate--alanine ligase
VEACEYGRSFHNLSPKILVITDIEEDHLDYYSGLAEIQEAFREMIEKVPADGFIICDSEDENLKEITKNTAGQIIDYKNFLTEIPHLFVPGKHNRENAAAALAVAYALKKLEKVSAENLPEINLEEVKKSLKSFKGTWRRLEFKGETINGALVYDDYAHHPSEIRATLQAARERFQGKKIRAVFQPHRYSRVEDLLDQFSTCFKDCDSIAITDIYAASEAPVPGLESSVLVDNISHLGHPNAFYIKTPLEGIEHFLNESQPGDIILTLGAGDLPNVYKQIF